MSAKTPQFQARHYEAIAAVVREGSGSTLYGMGTAGGLINEIAVMLAEDNPKFDRDRFLKACGVV